MPKALEKRLKSQARKRWRGKSKRNREKRNRYVYGTLRKLGWKPKNQR